MLNLTTGLQINRLCISSNDVSDDSFFVICSIIRQCQVKEIEMDRCRIVCGDNTTDSRVKFNIDLLSFSKACTCLNETGSNLGWKSFCDRKKVAS